MSFFKKASAPEAPASLESDPEPVVVDALPPTEPEPEPAPDPEPSAKNRKATVTGTVWKHGELHHNGKVYLPGEKVRLDADVAASLGEVFEHSKR